MKSVGSADSPRPRSVRAAAPEIALVERVEAGGREALERARQARQADELARVPRAAGGPVDLEERGVRTSAAAIEGAVRSTASMKPSQAGKPSRASSIAGAEDGRPTGGPTRLARHPRSERAPGTVTASAPRSGSVCHALVPEAAGIDARAARPEPLSASWPARAASQMSQKASPPIPQALGMTTPRTAFVAMAASIAFPPARRTPSPAAVARWCGATTAPWRPRAVGTGTSGPWPASVTASLEDGPPAGLAEDVLVPPQDQERHHGCDQQHDRGDQDAVESEPVGGHAGDEAAGDLANAQEHRCRGP